MPDHQFSPDPDAVEYCNGCGRRHEDQYVWLAGASLEPDGVRHAVHRSRVPEDMQPYISEQLRPVCRRTGGVAVILLDPGDTGPDIAKCRKCLARFGEVPA